MSRRDAEADEQRVLAEQVAYYRARAPEYDDWFYRRGVYDNGAEWNGRWRAELDELAGALDRARPGGTSWSWPAARGCGPSAWRRTPRR